MRTRAVRFGGIVLLVILMSCCVTAGAQTARRELHWDALDVEAHLDADGVLEVTERHTMVFTGDWNGGERVFNVRPRQRLQFLSLERIDETTGSRQSLEERSVPTNVDEYSWTGNRTLRWRSRLPSDPPFANTRLIYVLRYKLSGILVAEDAQYRLDHDFSFPNRPGPIGRFTLNLDFDPAWQPLSEFQGLYNAGPLEPGRSFVLNVPLRYSGPGNPAAFHRPPEIVAAVTAILALFAVLVWQFAGREYSLGRFAPIDTVGIDRRWIESHILRYPAEVVGAAWDGRIGTSEVVALIARMTAEGKLESRVEGKDSMKLSLKVDREGLNGYERELVDGLFFDNRTETSTKEVQRHYKSVGFNPATVIKPDLETQVQKLVPPGARRFVRATNLALLLALVVLLVWTVSSAPAFAAGAMAVTFISLLIGAFLQIPGWLFRSRIDWGPAAAALFLLPALFVSLGTSAFLWFVVGTGEVELPWTMTSAIAVLALWISNASINGMKSRQSRDAIAFRKRLSAGRSFFLSELGKTRPGLLDSWYPWMLAFGLGRQVDLWSSHHGAATRMSSPTGDHTTSFGPAQSSSSQAGWSGGGGLSGGAGASGVWAAAAAGMAAGVSPPSSSGSSGSSGGSSGGGSSGGGGGGGW